MLSNSLTLRAAVSLSLTWAVSGVESRGFPTLCTEHFTAAVGTSPGRLVETDANFDIIHEWPEVTDVSSTLNILGEQHSPHGLSVDWDRNVILTSDFVVPLSILKPTLAIQKANTLRLWNLASRSIISTITIPNVRTHHKRLSIDPVS